jgi:phosphonate transport system ATP-binding protein
VVYDGPSSALTTAFLGELYGAESEELFLPRVGEKVGETAPEREHWPARSRAVYARDLALASGTA